MSSGETPSDAYRRTRSEGGLTVGERLRSIETKIDQLHGIVSAQAITTATREEKARALECRITKLEHWKDWAFRITMGAVLVAGLAMILN
jgi:hypothetical protein